MSRAKKEIGKTGQLSAGNATSCVAIARDRLKNVSRPGVKTAECGN